MYPQSVQLLVPGDGVEQAVPECPLGVIGPDALDKVTLVLPRSSASSVRVLQTNNWVGGDLTDKHEFRGATRGMHVCSAEML